MLFTDSVDLVTRASILAAQPEIEAVEAGESVSLSSVMPVAWDRAAQWLRTRLHSAGGAFSADTHTMAVLATGSSIGALRARLNRVYVDAQLREWYRALAILCFYEAVARRKNADRHAAKLEQSRERLAECEALVWSVQYVDAPLAAPGATQGPNVGRWSVSNVSGVAGGADAQTTYRIAVTWTGASYVSQPVRAMSESAPSATVLFTLPASQRLVVSIAGLSSPGSVAWQGGTVEGPWVEMRATGWNVWVGDGAGAGPMYLQTATPIAVATTSYQFSAAPVLSGYESHEGQPPTGSIPVSFSLMRG